MNTEQQVGERDRDRALLKLRLLTAASGIASLAVAALGTSAAVQASTPAAKPSGSGPANANAAVGTLSTQQLAALKFALPKQGTVVVWKSAGQAYTGGGRTSAPMPATAGGGGGTVSAPAPAPAPAPPAPAPVPPPPPVAHSGTS